ncbi:MAG: lactate utilization protein [Kiritimatiellae bacterium]|nr:lactate utilization protein [Kiritimatiellia bacterium]
MTMIEQFVERAEAVSAKVVRVRSGTEADAVVARERERAGVSGFSVDVIHAARGIASTGTCVVEADEEATRLATLVPEVSVIVLRTSDLVPDLPDLAPFLRERQSAGCATCTSFITGPSRTADIERVSAVGVHGPLELTIILVED